MNEFEKGGCYHEAYKRAFALHKQYHGANGTQIAELIQAAQSAENNIDKALIIAVVDELDYQLKGAAAQ